jgi:DNA polymerase-3 subunit epsilon
MIALFFDTETTGIKTRDNPNFKPALVQLGCILQDLDTGRVLAELNLIANQYPDAPPIPQGAINVHGITNEMAKEYGIDPKLIDLAFAKLIEKCDVLVAHNIDYDLEVMQDNMPLSWNAKPIGAGRNFDTMKGNLYIVKAPLSDKQRAYFGMKGIPPDAPYKVPNLTETHMHYFGEAFFGAHDAMADIRACRDIFTKMLDAGWYQLLDGTVQPTDKLDQLLTAEGSK